MVLDTVRARWMEATYPNQPQARCGHSAVAVDARAVWGEEFLVVFGGIDAGKEALDDLAVLQCDQEAWFAPQKAAVGPAARAFHAAAVVGSRMYLFGGHVYVKQQHKLHQFNDLWCLDTSTWEWSRLSGEAPDAPQPCPRDRAAMAPVGDGRLLVVGGADALNRRLDDAWLFDTEKGSWSEVKTSGARPRARCCTTLFPLNDRVLMFGGDTYGVTNELWSLRGLEGDGPAQWTQLHLEGPPPPPRRGHAVAATGSWVVFVGGLTEQRSLMGMKSKSEHLSDVVILDRRDRVSWRGVESASQPPAPREKHTLTALSGGRLLLFGGTDGAATLGDAWWLDLEDFMPPQPEVLTHADVAHGASQPLPEVTAAPLLPPKPPPESPSAAAPAPAGAHRQAAAQSPGQAAAVAGGGAAALTGGLAYLQQSIPTLSAAVSSLRGRLGLPASASGSQLAAAQQAAAIAEEQDEGLQQLGRRALGEGSGGGASRQQLAAAGRRFLATATAQQLRLGDLPVLMTDYRRLAKLGWGMLLRERGPEALSDPGLQLPGRFMHLRAEDLRMREVPEVLSDYQLLYCTHASLADAGQGATGTPVTAARPATPASLI